MPGLRPPNGSGPTVMGMPLYPARDHGTGKRTRKPRGKVLCAVTEVAAEAAATTLSVATARLREEVQPSAPERLALD